MDNYSVRSDYKITRNKKIYFEYLDGYSLNELGDRYKLSPQRVSRIINEVRDKKYIDILTQSSSIEKRNKYRDRAIRLRERGSLEISLEILGQILIWDKENNFPGGYIDTLGHLRIVYSRMALESKDRKEATKYLKEATNYGQKALDLAKREKDNGKIAISSVHYASALLALSTLKKTRNEGELKEALKVLDKVLNDFPGSKAHKSWPLKLKAEILTELEEPDEAFKVLNTAELCILNGYKKELKDKHGEIKLQVWLSGIWLAKSRVCIKLKYPILAKMYAESVLGCIDSEKILGERKKEAKLILTALE